MALTVEEIEETIDEGIAYWEQQQADSSDANYQHHCSGVSRGLSLLRLWIAEQKLNDLLEKQP